MFSSEQDPYTPLVKRVMTIEDITFGDDKQHFLARYHGRLVSEDSAALYDDLAAALRPLNVTPLFRVENGRQTVFLVKGLVTSKPSNPVWNLVTFILTLFSVLLAGAMYNYQGEISDDILPMLGMLIKSLPEGIPFALSMLSILAAHEFGHYLAARYHKTQVTLPYFIPLPLSPLGTLGAFIQMKEPPKNRNMMLDIGLAGPLAGLAVTIPLLFYGLSTSPVQTLPANLSAEQSFSLEGNSILYLGAKYLTKGEILPAPVSYDGVNPLLYWLRYILTSTPLPFGGRDVLMNSVTWAAWAGLLVTSLNLIPAGQLDGGHIMYVLIGKKAVRLWPFIVGALVLMGFFWSGWWLWAMLIFWLGRIYAEPLDLITPVDSRRRALAILGIIIFILVFIPVPLLQL